MRINAFLADGRRRYFIIDRVSFSHVMEVSILERKFSMAKTREDVEVRAGVIRDNIAVVVIFSG